MLAYAQSTARLAQQASRSRDFLGSAPARGVLPRDSFAVHPSRFGAPGSLAAATGSTEFGGRVHVTLRDFVPPLLLSRAPDFLGPATRAYKRNILVVTALDELRCAVAVIRRKRANGDAYQTIGSRRQALRFTSPASLLLTGHIIGNMGCEDGEIEPYLNRHPRLMPVPSPSNKRLLRSQAAAVPFTTFAIYSVCPSRSYERTFVTRFL